MAASTSSPTSMRPSQNASARPTSCAERRRSSAAGTEDGLRRVAALVAEHAAATVVVGLPLTLRGERGEQALETERFVEGLRRVLQVPVVMFDERFTTRLAEQSGSAGAEAEEDARAAAHLLAGYLELSGGGGA